MIEQLIETLKNIVKELEEKNENLPLNYREFAEFFNVSERTVPTMIKDGRIEKKDIIRINQGTGNHPADEQKRTGKVFIDAKSNYVNQLLKQIKTLERASRTREKQQLSKEQLSNK